MNKVILSGRLTKDVELRETESGKKVLRNSIATRRNYKNANNEYDSDFINIVLFDKKAEFLATYGKKGINVLASGSLRTGSYVNDKNETVYTTDLYVDEIELLEKKENKEKSNTEIVKDVMETDPFAEFGETVSIDDNFLD